MTNLRSTACASLLAFATLAAAAAPGAAAPQAAAPQPVEATKGDGAAATRAPASVGYAYEPQGRRDPFVSLLSRGTDGAAKSNRAAGLPGLLINEVIVKGIVRDRSGFIAMIQGPDTKTFIIRSGERLMDGTVKAITADSVVFSQEVNDPLSMVKQKEIRKMVRTADGGGRG